MYNYGRALSNRVYNTQWLLRLSLKYTNINKDEWYGLLKLYLYYVYNFSGNTSRDRMCTTSRHGLYEQHVLY